MTLHFRTPDLYISGSGFTRCNSNFSNAGHNQQRIHEDR